MQQEQRVIYHRGGNPYQNELERLKNCNISDYNRELILSFHKSRFTIGNDKSRVIKLSTQLRKICQCLEKDLNNVCKKDIEDLLFKVNTQFNYSENTKADYRRGIKQFWKWLKGKDKPKETGWIKINNGKLANKLLTGDILNPDDIKKLVEAAESVRDKAFVAFLYESGCRISEVLNVKLGDYKPNQKFAKVRVNGKTGERFITLISCTPYISQYLSICHPNRNESDYLWKSLGTYHNNQPLRYVGAIKILKRLFLKAKLIQKEEVDNKVKYVGKRFNPHIFRHSRATELAKYLTDVQMCLFFGWRIGSGQTRTYVHASGRDVDEAILKSYGIKEAETVEKPKIDILCSRCNKVNGVYDKYCSGCGLGLDLKTVLEDEEKKKFYTSKAFEILEEIYNNPQLLERFKEFKTKN